MLSQHLPDIDFRDILDQLLAGCQIIDLDWRYLYVNDAAARHGRKKAGELLGHKMMEVYPGIEDTPLFEMLRRCMADRTPAKLINEFVYADGDRAWLELNAQPVSAGLFIMSLDITARQRAEEALHESEDRFAAFMDNLPGLVLIKDHDLRPVYANRPYRDLFPADAWMGKTPEETFPPEIAEPMIRNDRIALEDRYVQYEEKWTDRGGVDHTFETRKFRIERAQKAPWLGAIIMDITARKQAEEAMRESEEKYRQLFEVESDALFLIHNETGQILEANAAASALYGYSHEEFLTMKNTDVSAEPDKTHQAMAEQMTLIPVRWHRKKDGALMPVEITASHLTWHGQPVHIAAVRDITERMRMAQAEHDQRRLAEALRDTAAALNGTLNLDEVFDRILDNVGRVVPHDAANISLIDEHKIARFVRLHGYAALGKEDFIRSLGLPLSDVPNLQKMVDSAEPVIVSDTQSNPSWYKPELSTWVRSYAGMPICLESKVIGFLNLDSATPNFFTLVHLDRLRAFADQAAIAIRNAQLYETVQRYADQLEGRVAARTRELTEANRRLTELDRLKDEFVSRVSHELRTPLANIKLYLDLLDRGKPDKYAQYMETLHRESIRLQRLIDDLLNISQLDMDLVPVRWAPIDVNRLIGQLVIDRSGLAAERGLSIESQIDPDLPPAWADAMLVSQVMSNLMTNATNYTPAGGTITLSTARCSAADRDWVTFIVRDTGPGISDHDRPHLFERFYRGDAARDYATPGTGLGLAICREIVGKLGGRITVESEAGHGAAFTVWLKPAVQINKPHRN